ncbi:MAG: class I SAM-dependent methyltransferase [Balneolaceae bacterium]|nr:class I SAM-dependent methyltransferase [Balneolaceae bacterium]
MSSKEQIWRLLPNIFKKLYLKIKPTILNVWNRDNAEEVFTEIYKKDLWGKADEGYFSGIGSLNDLIVSRYVNTITEEADRQGFRDKTFVDLGCGDFRVGQQLVPLSSKYIAVDVVKPLIEYNLKKYAAEKIEFHHLDIVNDELPEGEVCFVRQVLQHLSNQQIKKILEKLDMYKWVYITEHYPRESKNIRPNVNKVPDLKIRLEYQSGVYLSEPPFNVPLNKLKQILEVPATGKEGDDSIGVIRTILYMPNA